MSFISSTGKIFYCLIKRINIKNQFLSCLRINNMGSNPIYIIKNEKKKKKVFCSYSKKKSL